MTRGDRILDAAITASINFQILSVIGRSIWMTSIDDDSRHKNCHLIERLRDLADSFDAAEKRCSFDVTITLDPSSTVIPSC